MQPLIKGLHAEFVPAKWDGKDTSGIRVTGKAVLVLMDECATTTSGGIQLTDDMVEKLSEGAEIGVLVATSEGAFRLYEDCTPWSGYKPVPGDRVYVAKYSGQLVRGKDGRKYRLMDYNCIGAVYEPDAKEAS